MAVRKRNMVETKKPRIVQSKRTPALSSTGGLGSIAVRERNPVSEPPSLLVFTLIVIYKNLYILGVSYLRKQRRLLRRIRYAVHVELEVLHVMGEHLSVSLRRLLRRITQHFRSPFQRISGTYREIHPLILEKRRKGEKAFTLYLDIATPVARLIWNVIATIFNYAAPILAVLFLISHINTYSEKSWGLHVVYYGEDLGYVQDEAEFEWAVQDVRERIISSSAQGHTQYIPSNATFTLVEMDGLDFVNPQELADNILRIHSTDIAEAYGFYIDDVFLGAVSDKDIILEELSKILQENRKNLPNEYTEFEKSIALEDKRYYPTDSIIPVSSLLTTIRSNEDEADFYVVQEGDVPSTIADKLGISYSRLVEMNRDLNIEESIHVGDVLQIAVSRPFLSVKNIYTQVYTEEYDYETIETQNATYVRGYREVTQEGVPGERRVTAEITAVNGLEVDRQVLDTYIITEAIPERVIIGVNDPSSIAPNTSASAASPPSSTVIPDTSGTGFMWPANGGYVSAGLYGYRGHTGMDIAGPGVGSNVYASMAGTVTLAKRTWVGYGHYIVISHGNGYETLYAHNSELYVNVGDYVEKGQVIAAMGRTGNATGPHLHFEIRQNGRIMDPSIFIGG